jgi:hypothetical protein
MKLREREDRHESCDHVAGRDGKMLDLPVRPNLSTDTSRLSIESRRPAVGSLTALTPAAGFASALSRSARTARHGEECETVVDT